MKRNVCAITAVVLGIIASSFVSYKHHNKTDTYFFVFDATGQHIIYPEYPNTPPTSSPVTCGTPNRLRCVAEYSSFTINPYSWPLEYVPSGILLSMTYKPLPF